MTFVIEEKLESVSFLVSLFEIIFWIILVPFELLILLFQQLGLIAKANYPTGEEVLSMAPPRSFLTEDEMTYVPKDIDVKVLNDKVISVLHEHLLKRRQLGVSVVAYYKGQLIVHVGGGVYRTACGKPAWKPVSPATRFMIQSVTKSVCACGVLALVSEGHLDYDSKVADLWPEFATQAKHELTVAEALSHRAGLTCAGGDVPIVIARNLWYVSQSGWHSTWNTMCGFIERASPEWIPGKFAAYHPVAYSWILGGIIDRIMRARKIDWGTEASSVSYLVHKMVAAPLSIPMDEVYVGCIPPSMEDNLARIEVPSCSCSELRRTCAAGKGQGSVMGSFRRWLEVNIGGPIEGWAVTSCLNLSLWRRLCLPSSNGAMTARAVGKIYGALANGGGLPINAQRGDTEEQRFASATAVESLARKVHESANSTDILPCKHPDGDHKHIRARLGCGFFPWYALATQI